MAKLVLVAYPPDDPLGIPSGTLVSAYDTSVSIEDDGIGAGSFAIHPDDAEAAWCVQDAYVAAYRDTVSGDLLAGFWVDALTEVVLSPDEGGGRELRVAGRGPIAILEEAIVWHKARSGSPTVVYPAKGEWRWKQAHPARPLVRLLEEAQRRGALAAVSWDFDRDTDSDGVPWADTADAFSLPIGSTLLDVVRILREAGLHIAMGPDLVLHARDTHGRDLSGPVDFSAGVDIRDTAEVSATARRGRSAVLVAGEDEDAHAVHRAVVDSTLETALGRRKEGFFAYQRTATTAVLRKVGQRKLRRWKTHYDGPFTLGVIDTPGKVALIDYTVGDTVAVPTAFASAGKERIAAVTLTDTEDGSYEPTLEFGDLTPDPVSGVTPSGDVEGAGCCGEVPGVGGRPSGGGDGSPGVGATIDAALYPLDDFARAGAGTPVIASTSDIDPIGYSEGTTYYELPLPDGCDVPGRHLVALVNTEPYSDMYAAMTGAGWTKLLATSGSTWFWKRLGGADGTDPTGYPPSGASDAIAVEDVAGGITPVVTAVVLLVAGLYDEGASNPGPWTISSISTSADPDDIGDPGWNGDMLVLTGLRNDGAAITAGPAGYTEAGTDAETHVALGETVQTRVDHIVMPTGPEDPSPYVTGASSGLYDYAATVGLRLEAGTIAGWGAIPQGRGVDTEAPWAGGNPYETSGSDMAFSVAGGVGVMAATADGASGTAELVSEDEDAETEGPWGPWTDGLGLFELVFKVDPLGDVTDTSPNLVTFSVAGDGWRGSLCIHLGDAVDWSYLDPDGQRGIVVAQRAGIVSYSDFVPKVLEADTWYLARFDTRGETVRAKLWPASTGEPAAWDIAVAKAYQPVTGNWLSLRFDANAGMTLSVSRIDAALGAAPGGRLGRHLVAVGDGATTTFALLSPFVAGTLRVWVDNQPVVPLAFDADAGTFTLSRAPYGDPSDPAGSALVEAGFEVA